MDLEQLERRLLNITNGLLREGVLDDAFKRMKESEVHLQISGFVYDTVNLYLGEAEKTADEIHSTLKHTGDVEKVLGQAMRLKGSSIDVGAKEVDDACALLIQRCKEHNEKLCFEALRKVRDELNNFKSKIVPLLEVEEQIIAFKKSTEMQNKS